MQGQYHAISCLLYETMMNKYNKITKVCCKYGNFGDLSIALEEFSKSFNIDVSLVNFIFFGENVPSFGKTKLEQVFGIKPVKERILEAFKDEDLEPNYDDIQTLLTFKNETIEGLKIKNNSQEETIKNISNIMFQYVNAINALKFEIENLKKTQYVNTIPLSSPTSPPGLTSNIGFSEPKLLGLPSDNSSFYNLFSSNSIWK